MPLSGLIGSQSTSSQRHSVTSASPTDSPLAVYANLSARCGVQLGANGIQDNVNVVLRAEILVQLVTCLGEFIQIAVETVDGLVAYTSQLRYIAWQRIVQPGCV